jgi:N-terminal domain of toast_rack, DUF2154
MTAKPLLLAATILSLAGCVVENAGPTHHEFSSFDRDKVETLRLNLVMGVGQLTVGAGTEKLVRADFGYSVPSWKPVVDFSTANGRGDMTIRQPETHHANFGHNEYRWDLLLNRDVPLDLSVHFGAGESKLDLGSLSLRSVSVDMGVGKVEMDLRGTPTKNYDVSINGGVGEATVRLPGDVGIVADAHGGIGDIHASGLRKEEGGRYVNDAYGAAKVTVHVTVNGGVGSIRLIAD